MMCKQMLINDIKNKFTELAPNKEISYNTTALHLDLTYGL